LTGIASFDVPPYRFDLSPFLGRLNDGKTHNISATVRHNNKAGVWYLDGVFHAELGPTASILTGDISHHSDHRPSTTVVKSSQGNTTTMYITRGHRELSMSGYLRDSDGKLLRNHSLVYSLEAFNNNTLIGQNLQISDGWMHSSSTESTLVPAAPSTTIVRRARFPYFVSDNSTQDKTTFQIGPTIVNYSRAESLEIQSADESPYQLQVSGSINATALYNRSLTNHTLVYKQKGTSEEATHLSVGAKSCFSRYLTADAGHTTSHHSTSEACDWRNTPLGVYNCGLSFCRQLDGISRDAKGFLPSTVLHEEPDISLQTIFM
jgi:prepilin-type processing-associated H-X9-DG protein